MLYYHQILFWLNNTTNKKDLGSKDLGSSYTQISNKFRQYKKLILGHKKRQINF
jgi:hypothetical protein